MPPTRSSTSGTIVICDDQAPYRFFLRALLEQHRDIQVVGEGWHGGQAIELVRTHRPDVLVMDLAMPIMDGFAALPHVREASAETQVLVLTGLQDADPLERALALGATMAVSKSIDPLELVAHVRDLSGLSATTLPS